MLTRSAKTCFMLRLTVCVVLTLGCVVVPPRCVSGQDAATLFSEIEMSDVVSTSVAAPIQSPTEVNVEVNASGIQQLLNDESIQSDVKSQDVFVSAKQFGGDSTIKFTADSTSRQILLQLPIGEIKPGKHVDGKQLMNVLLKTSANPRIAVSADASGVFLMSSLANHRVTSGRLRDACKELVAMARQTASLVQTAATPQPNASRSQPQVAVAAPTLVGTWSARVSQQDAWAIQFNRDRSFTMVHTRNQKNSISKGTYQVAAGQLVLSETGGVKLSGKLEMNSARSLRWSLQNAMTLSFTKK